MAVTARSISLMPTNGTIEPADPVDQQVAAQQIEPRLIGRYLDAS